MTYLVSSIWGWMLAALVLGLIIGWWTCSRERGSWFSGWVPIALILFAVGLVAALLAWFPGRPGLWLETALLLFASYIAGCCLGCWFKQLTGGGAAEIAPVAGAAAVAAAAAPRPVAAPAPVARPSANPGGPVTPLPEPVFSALKLRPQAAPAPVPAAPRPAPVPALAASPRPVAAPPLGGPLTPMPEPVASALRQRLPASFVSVTPHPMSGLTRPAPVAPPPPPAPRPVAPTGPAPTATLRPAGIAPTVAAASTSASTRLPEPVYSALRQQLPPGEVTTAQVTGAGVRVAPQAPVDPSRPGVVHLTQHDTGTVRLEAHVSEVKSPGADTHPGMRPKGLSAARGAGADDLILIKGVGPKNEKILHSLGVWHFDQVAHWTPQEAQWVGSYMKFPGRIEREHWIEQCRLLAAGGDTAHSLAVKSGNVKRDDSADDSVSAADAAALRAGLEELAPPLPDEDKHEGRRPFGLLKPRGGKADDLKRIRGIGPQNEGRLHALGIWHFDQIVRWSHDNVLWVGSFLAFPGRIDREEWLAQAKVLASGHETEFSKRADAGLVATSKDDGSRGQGNVAPIDPKAPPKK